MVYYEKILNTTNFTCVSQRPLPPQASTSPPHLSIRLKLHFTKRHLHHHSSNTYTISCSSSEFSKMPYSSSNIKPNSSSTETAYNNNLPPNSSKRPSTSSNKHNKLFNFIHKFTPPRYFFRAISALILGGQAILGILQFRSHGPNTWEQLNIVGPKSFGVTMLTAAFVGMVFTIQFVREFAKLGLTRSVGGVLALALARELTPVVTSVILAGRVGSAFAAELGTMAVSEQTDSLRVLATDPVHYLITPRILACLIVFPIINVFAFCTGMAAAVLLAEVCYFYFFILKKK